MSLRNFYQTFYETEQLFRLENDPFVTVVAPTTVSETLLIDVDPTETGQLLPPAPVIEPLEIPITAPIDGPPVVEPEAVVIEPAPVVEPLEHEPAVLEQPVYDHDVLEQPVILEAAPAKTLPSTHRPSEPVRPDAAPPLLNHKVLILVDEELLPSDVLFLEKILNAINLNVKGVDLLNVHGLDGVDFGPILADKVIHHFLTFGVPFQRLNLDILMDRYQPVRFHGITFMMADPLAAIEGDKVLKKRLWEALKRIFLMG